MRCRLAPPVELPAEFDETLARLYSPQPFSPFKRRWQASAALPDELPIHEAALPDATLEWRALHADDNQFVNSHLLDGNLGGLVYARGEIEVPTAMTVDLMLGPDGPGKVWVDDEVVGVIERAENPGRPYKQSFPVALAAGRHVVTIALNRRGGAAWGFSLRFRRTDESYSVEELQAAQALLPLVDP